MKKDLSYHIHNVIPYINWVYFFHALGFPPFCAQIAEIHACPACRRGWLQNLPDADQPKAEAAIPLFDDAIRCLNDLDSSHHAYVRFALLKAVSRDEDIIVTTEDEGKKVVLPFLRQQQTPQKEAPNLCLSDFIRPEGSGQSDTIGLFAATIKENKPTVCRSDDPYRNMLIQTLCDRLAEAATEKMHEDVRKTYWGYAADENLSIKELLNERFQGIRPAIGYPSLPDQSLIFLIDDLLDMKGIGIRLTENGAMSPHATVCGLMFAHPQARYFGIGKIGEDQLADYARRRGLPTQTLRKFLTSNLITS